MNAHIANPEVFIVEALCYMKYSLFPYSPTVAFCDCRRVLNKRDQCFSK